MFGKILIANRGEIALRVLRACKELGIATVAVHSTADASAMHVKLADESVCIGPPPARDSYLNIPALLAACEITGAEAVHPGYGFLAENARFAEILIDHGVQFIGPKPEHIRIMGDKIEAKKTAKRLGIPCVPGSDGGVSSDEEAAKVAREIGFPVLIKARRRRRRARHEGGALRAGTVLGAVDRPLRGSRGLRRRRGLYREISRHAAPHRDPGAGRRQGQRHPSRRARLLAAAPAPEGVGGGPSPIITPEQRARIGGTVAQAMRDLKYLGAGTIEFLYENGEFYFIEMNTRIQVEHPVTEAITGVDLINEQIRVAAGLPMSVTQDDIVLKGHAIECRVNAEHPRTFRPSPGRITNWHVPGGPGVRVDSAVYQGYSIPPYYDSLAGKLIVTADTREQCLARLRRAIDEFVVEGIETTLPLFRELLENDDIKRGAYDIHWLEAFLAEGEPGS